MPTTSLFANYTPTSNTYVRIYDLDGTDYVDQLWDTLTSTYETLFKTVPSTTESGDLPTITVHPQNTPYPAEIEIREGTTGSYTKYDLSPYGGPRPDRPVGS